MLKSLVSAIEGKKDNYILKKKFPNLGVIKNRRKRPFYKQMRARFAFFLRS